MKLRKYSKFDSILKTGLWQTKSVLYKFYLNFCMFLLVVVIVVNVSSRRGNWLFAGTSIVNDILIKIAATGFVKYK